MSELSAITQYINNQNRMSCEKCPLAKMILGIAVAEMMHLQKLGELIDLLGGEVDYAVMKYQEDAVCRYRIRKSCNCAVPETYQYHKR